MLGGVENAKALAKPIIQIIAVKFLISVLLIIAAATEATNVAVIILEERLVWSIVQIAKTVTNTHIFSPTKDFDNEVAALSKILAYSLEFAAAIT